jgi:DNA-binding transcriptional regulator YiaG
LEYISIKWSIVGVNFPFSILLYWLLSTFIAAEKFSKSDVEALNVAAKILINIGETKIAKMAKNGQTIVSLFNNVRGRREVVCVNRAKVESVLQDCRFSYIGNDKFKFATAADRKKPIATIVKALRDARRELGISQSMLVRQLNVSVSYISAIETGQKHPSIAQVVRFAEAFGMELSITLKRKDNAPLLE